MLTTSFHSTAVLSTSHTDSDVFDYIPKVRSEPINTKQLVSRIAFHHSYHLNGYYPYILNGQVVYGSMLSRLSRDTVVTLRMLHLLRFHTCAHMCSNSEFIVIVNELISKLLDADFFVDYDTFLKLFNSMHSYSPFDYSSLHFLGKELYHVFGVDVREYIKPFDVPIDLDMCISSGCSDVDEFYQLLCSLYYGVISSAILMPTLPEPLQEFATKASDSVSMHNPFQSLGYKTFSDINKRIAAHKFVCYQLVLGVKPL